MSTQHRLMTRLCVGCGLCLGLCPTNAICLGVVKGVLTVNFDHERCNSCALCVKACPALSNFYAKNVNATDVLGKIEKIYFGYSADRSIRYHGASGGIATALALYMLDKGIVSKVLVTKLRKFFAFPFLTDNEEEVISAQGSIYFKTFSLRVIQKLINHLRKGEKICVIGLPCQISALKKMLKDFEDKLYFIGLLCGHTNELWYLQCVIEKYLPKGAQPIAMGPRKDGWPGGVNFLFKIKGISKEILVPLYNFWGILASLGISSPLGCLFCQDHLASEADIVVADAWHPKFVAKNAVGVSVLIVRNAKWLDIIKAAMKVKVIHFEEAKLQDLLITHGFHVVEATYFAPLKKKIFRFHGIPSPTLKRIDGLIIILLMAMVYATLNFRIARRLLSSSVAKKPLRIILRALRTRKLNLSRKISRLNERKII